MKQKKKKIDLDYLETFFDLSLPLTVNRIYKNEGMEDIFQKKLILSDERDLIEFYGIIAMNSPNAMYFEMFQKRKNGIGIISEKLPKAKLIVSLQNEET